MRRITDIGYGLWCWLVFIPLITGLLIFALPVPQVRTRRHMARALARLFFKLAGTRLLVLGLENIPDSACIVVANHASYLDGIILTAALPPHFAFVIKREMARAPLAGTLLTRLGAEFVERFDRKKGSTDARRVLRTAARGQALAFFPEGTFNETPGLAYFHAGAFVTAARNGLCVLPTVIHGARHMLPAGRALPRHGLLVVEILAAVAGDPAAPNAAHHLKSASRRAILSRLTEPDLETQSDA